MGEGKRTRRDGWTFLPEPDLEQALPGEELYEPCRRMLARQTTAMSIRDARFRPLYANPAYLELFDTSREDWLAGRCGLHLDPVTEDHLRSEVQEKIAAGLTWKGELTISPPGLPPRLVVAEYSSTRDASGALTHFYATYNDVSRIRRLESELQEQIEFLHGIIDTLPDPVFVKSGDRRFLMINEAFCALAGRRRSEMLGKTDHDFFPRGQADTFREQDDKALAASQAIANEEDITDASGRTRRLLTRKRGRTLRDGSRVVVGLARDITDQRLLEQAMAQSYHQLEKALASLRGGMGELQRAVGSEASKADAIQGLISRSNEFFRDFLEQTGTPPVLPPARPGESPHLSPREYQVALLLAKGHRIKDVAAHLRVSPNSVSTYRSRIMKKLGLASNTDLIQYALRNGLL